MCARRHRRPARSGALHYLQTAASTAASARALLLQDSRRPFLTALRCPSLRRALSTGWGSGGIDCRSRRRAERIMNMSSRASVAFDKPADIGGDPRAVPDPARAGARRPSGLPRQRRHHSEAGIRAAGAGSLLPPPEIPMSPRRTRSGRARHTAYEAARDRIAVFLGRSARDHLHARTTEASTSSPGLAAAAPPSPA